jgi:hypothetical protein
MIKVPLVARCDLCGVPLGLMKAEIFVEELCGINLMKGSAACYG